MNMDNASNIYKVIDELKNLKGTNAKKELLKKYNVYPFKELLYFTYNPKYVYNVKETFPKFNKSGVQVLDSQYESLKQLALKLRDRELSGNDAIDAITLLGEKLNKFDQDLMKRILTKDLKIGMQSKTINSVFKNLIPETPYMRCSTFNEKTAQNIKFPAIAQTKEDGEFLNLICTDNIIDKSHPEFEKFGELINKEFTLVDGIYIQIKTRAGQRKEILEKHFSRYLIEIRKKIGYNICIHGEVLIKGMHNRMESNGALNRDDISDQLDNIYVSAWDVIKYEDWIDSKSSILYSDRFSTLKAAIDKNSIISLVDYVIVNDLTEMYNYYNKIVTAGGEGVVLKDWRLDFKFGDSKYQLKVKVKFDVDVQIKGFTPGTGKNVNLFGSIECVSSCGSLLTAVGVSSFTEAQANKIHANRDKYIGMIMKVQANDITPPVDGNPYWSLSHPRHLEIRTDKFEADDIDRIKEQLEAQKTINIEKDN